MMMMMKASEGTNMRKKKYKYALVQNALWHKDGFYSVESKKTLGILARIGGGLGGRTIVICDDQPIAVLRGMLKLLEEG